MNFEATQERWTIRSTVEEVAVEFGPEYWREIDLTRLAPASQQMAYNQINKELGLPKSC